MVRGCGNPHRCPPLTVVRTLSVGTPGVPVLCWPSPWPSAPPGPPTTSSPPSPQQELPRQLALSHVPRLSHRTLSHPSRGCRDLPPLPPGWDLFTGSARTRAPGKMTAQLGSISSVLVSQEGNSTGSAPSYVIQLDTQFSFWCKMWPRCLPPTPQST